ARRLAADEVSAHRHRALAARRPERRDDVSGPRSPVEASDYRLRNLQGVHESDGIERDSALLATSRRTGGKKPGRAVAAYVRHDHAVALRCEQRRDVHVAVYVVRPAVKEQHRLAAGGSDLGISDSEGASVNRSEEHTSELQS